MGEGQGGGGNENWSDVGYFNNHFWNQGPSSSSNTDGLAPGVGEQLPGMTMDPNQQEFDVSFPRRVFFRLSSSFTS